MHSVVIVAAGKGTRMGAGTDKLFLKARGQTVIGHTWQRFDACEIVDEVVLVIASGREADFTEVAEGFGPAKPYRFVAGGAERQDSVWNGINATDGRTTVVAIHDGARPCVSQQTILDCFAAAQAQGASVAASRVADTLKLARADQTIESNVDRSRLWAVQTPQVFRREVILKAMSEVRTSGAQVTDDTAACELIGQPVTLVESRAPNPKVTVPADLPFVEWLLSQG